MNGRPSQTNNSLYFIVLAAILCIPALSFQFLLFKAPLWLLATQGAYDDTFLYLQIARNWTIKGFPSFDGITWTNGFQPLWQLFLLLVAQVTTETESFFRSSYLVALTLYLFSLWPLLRTLRLLQAFEQNSPLHSTQNAFGQLVLVSLWLLPLTVSRTISGMEDSLHCLVFSALLMESTLLFTQIQTYPTRRLIILGVLLGVNGLTRLDSGLISCLISLPLALLLFRHGRYAAICLMYAPAAAILTLYLGLNWIYFETLLPISGTTKIYWASGDQAPFLLVMKRAFSIVSHLWANMLSIDRTNFIVPTLVIFRGMFYTRPKIAKAEVLLILIVSAHAALVYILLRQFSTNSLWYYSSIRVAAALVISVGATALFSISVAKPIQRLVLWILLLSIFGTASFRLSQFPRFVTASENTFHRLRYEAALWLKSKASDFQNEKFGSWNAGAFGYFADPVKVVNLDGLVQDKKFLSEVILKQDWQKYLDCNKINFLADYNDGDGTQTFNKTWDKTQVFRGLVPFNKSKIIASVGPEQVTKRPLLLDIRPWVADSESDCG